jgi:hypothetical protein
MTIEERERVRQNLFDASWAAVEPWDQFAWHVDRNGKVDTHVLHSSQALAIDLFGTIWASRAKNAIMTAVAANIGLDDRGPWQVHLEWKSKQNELLEIRQTQVDAAAESPDSVILFECKFTESGGGCSQTNQIRKGSHSGHRQCDGRYAVQLNPLNQVSSRCALAGKGIRYWDVIPSVLPYPSDQDYAPCPFTGEYFQWMRNIAVAHEVAKASRKRAAVVGVYADHPAFKMARRVRSAQWSRFAKSVTTVKLHSISYQEITALISNALPAHSDDHVEWQRLQRCIDRKISRAGADPKCQQYG